MYYTTIQNIPLALDEFEMFYFQLNDYARLLLTFNETQDLGALHSALQDHYDDPIEGIYIYRDAAQTDLCWSRPETFKINLMVENHSTNRTVARKQIELIPDAN